jgi:hypothetical protein
MFSALVNEAGADILGAYDFSGNTGTETEEAGFSLNSGVGNLAFGNFTRGPGLTASTGSGRLNSSGFTTGSLDLNDYYSFAITPQIGRTFSIDSIQFSQARSADGVRNVALRSSVDNFVTNIANLTLPNSDLFTQQLTFNFPLAGGPLSNINSPLNLRIYGFNSVSEAGIWGIGANNDSFFNILGFPATLSVSGAVTAVPEPSSIFMISVASLLFIRHRINAGRTKRWTKVAD